MHSSKALFPIDFIDVGIVTSFRFMHPSKALFPIDFIDDGIEIFVRYIQCLTQLFPISIFGNDNKKSKISLLLLSSASFNAFILKKN